MFSQASVSQSVHNWSHGYSVTTNSCYSMVGTHPTGMLSCLHLSIILFMGGWCPSRCVCVQGDTSPWDQILTPPSGPKTDSLGKDGY